MAVFDSLSGDRKSRGGASSRAARSFLRLPAVLCLGILIFALAAACGGTPAAAPTPDAPKLSPALEKLVAAAQEEGELTVLGQRAGSSLANAQVLARMQDAINETYGISIRLSVEPGPSGSQLVPRLIDELKAGQPASTDVFISPSSQLLGLARGEALMEIDWRELAPDLLDEEIGVDGTSIIYGATVMHIGYNTDLVKPEDLPKRFEDFMDPKYKGMIGTTVFAAGWIEAAILLGEDKATEIIQAMLDNGSIVGLSYTSQVDRVATGEFPIYAFDYNASGYLDAKAKGAPVDVAYLDDYFTARGNAIGIPKHSRAPNLGKLLAIFAVSPAGQEIMWDVIKRDSPLKKGSNTARFWDEHRARGVEVFFADDEVTIEYEEYFAGPIGGRLISLLRGD